MQSTPPQLWGVAENAGRHLHSRLHGSGSQISCEYRDGVLYLRGQSRSFYQKQMAERRAEEFGTLDKNGDGSLSFAELLGRQAGRRGDAPKTAGETPRAPAAPGGEAGGRAAVGERLLRTMDRNADGKISKDEWTGPEERFTNMDANKDGIIDAAEIQARVRGMGGRGEEAKKSQ